LATENRKHLNTFLEPSEIEFSRLGLSHRYLFIFATGARTPAAFYFFHSSIFISTHKKTEHLYLFFQFGSKNSQNAETLLHLLKNRRITIVPMT
jgi:hypothetical protein